MAVSRIKHEKQTGLPADEGNSAHVEPTDWYADHTFDDTPSGGSTFSTLFEECYFTNVYAGACLIVSSSGAGANVLSEAGHPGMVSMSTGTSTTGRSVLSASSSQQSLTLGGGVIRFGVIFIIPTLSDGTNTFTVRAGIRDGTTSDGNHGVYFRYTNGVNGGEWEGVALLGGSETTLDTNVAADTGWHRYEFEINAAGSSVEFFIDGASVGTISSGLPSSGSYLSPLAINKSAGGTSRVVRIDAYWLSIELTTAR